MTLWVTIASLAIAVSDAFAQQPLPYVGAFVGMTQSHVMGTGSGVTSRFGAAVSLRFAGDWSFQTGVTWTQKGWGALRPQDSTGSSSTGGDSPQAASMLIAAQYGFGLKKVASVGDNKNRTATFAERLVFRADCVTRVPGRSFFGRSAIIDSL